jgi:hypothetical protein
VIKGFQADSDVLVRCHVFSSNFASAAIVLGRASYSIFVAFAIVVVTFFGFWLVVLPGGVIAGMARSYISLTFFPGAYFRRLEVNRDRPPSGSLPLTITR